MVDTNNNISDLPIDKALAILLGAESDKLEGINIRELFLSNKNNTDLGLTSLQQKKLDILDRVIKEYAKEGIRGEILDSSQKVFDYMHPIISNERQELIYVLCIDVKGRLINARMVFKGGLTESICHPREIFKVALKNSSGAIILCHNHPSGDPKASKTDKKMTKELVKAGKILGIKVLDHVIIGDNRHYSFKENFLI